MTKSEVQKYLSNYKDDEELFVMWWDKEFIDGCSYKPITDKEWKGILDRLDGYGFGIVNEEIFRAMESELEDIKEK
ncbi:hypothetical protein CMI47_16610 [Candidatus Pacearchaeota archaeon]|jgi:hypothetical protein|nr:hypothetical protein [Candidatus Pacearchaeota archaeon]|tara:strand:- start:33 stop:260 length:228 start_codon:yes stop_codon:yes gene_type:complete